MPSPFDPSPDSATPASRPLGVTRETFALALLVASSLQIMENLLPRLPLFPWMRVGFSYVVILPFLLQYGPRAAFALFLARNVISILYGGQPLTSFLIGSGAGAMTFLAVGQPAAWAYRRGLIGILGASVVLATAFNLSQLAAVNLTLIRHSGFYFQIGPILAWSLLSGAAVALLIRFSEGELMRLFSPPAAAPEPSRPLSAPAAPFLAGLALLVLLFAVTDVRLQAPMLAVLMAAVPGRFRLILNTWPFFFYLAWLHLFHTSGEYLLGEWITREGAMNFALYSIRLANLILLGRWLARRLPWQWTGSSRSPYLQGFLLALPLLPELFAPSLRLGKDILRGLASGKRTGALAPAFEAWKTRMAEAAKT